MSRLILVRHSQASFFADNEKGRSEPRRLCVPFTKQTENPGRRLTSAPSSTSTTWINFWEYHWRNCCGTTRNSGCWPTTIATPLRQSKCNEVFSVCLRRFANCGAPQRQGPSRSNLGTAFELASSRGCDAYSPPAARVARLGCSLLWGISRSHSDMCWAVRRTGLSS